MSDLERLYILTLATEKQREIITGMLNERDKRISELVVEVNNLTELD